MRPNPHWILSALLTLALAAGPAVAHADFSRDFTLSGDELFVGNLIGEITVEGHTGNDFEITVDVRGEDADADRIRFDEQSGSKARLLVVFPLDEERDYVYPEMGRRSRTSFRVGRDNHESSWLSDLFDFGRDRIEVRGSGSGLELWADVTIRVPQGKSLVVDHGVGSIEATNLDADVMLSVNSGHIVAEQIEGIVELDTGSGHVEARDVTGDLLVDTGSGHVDASNVKGKKVSIDTGSGHVDLELCEADEVEVDTGSGRVSLDEVECHDLAVDTGSGGVQGRRIGADAVTVDTGSGGVDMDMVRMGAGPYSIDTGSGSITLMVPDGASARVYAETSSGGIDVDVAGVDFRRRKRDHAEFEIGGGDADVDLETGSGTIRVVQR